MHVLQAAAATLAFQSIEVPALNVQSVTVLVTHAAGEHESRASQLSVDGVIAAPTPVISQEGAAQASRSRDAAKRVVANMAGQLFQGEGRVWGRGRV